MEEKKMVDLGKAISYVRSVCNHELETLEGHKSLLDSCQDAIVKMIEEKSEYLFLEDQNHFNRLLVKIGYGNIKQDYLHRDSVNVDLSELTETIETVSHKNRKRVLNESVVFDCLEEEERIILDMVLDGKTKKEIVNATGLTMRTYDRRKAEIIKKLKAINSQDTVDNLTSDYRNDPIECHSLDMADLRYRKVYGMDHAENKIIKQEKEKAECKIIPEKDWNDTIPYYHLLPQYNVIQKPCRKEKITAKPMGTKTKRPDMVFWNLPCELHDDCNHVVTVGHRRNYQAIHDAHVYARTHLPEIMAETKRRRVAMERPSTIEEYDAYTVDMGSAVLWTKTLNGYIA